MNDWCPLETLWFGWPTQPPISRRSTPFFAEMCQDFGWQSAAERVAPGHVADALRRHPSCKVILAERDGRAVGMANVATVFPGADLEPMLYMRAIFVVANERSRGVGGALMRGVARFAAEAGCSRVDWSTDRENARAQAFYDELGATKLTYVLSYKMQGEALQKLASEPD